jgi:hypothetical protein
VFIIHTHTSFVIVVIIQTHARTHRWTKRKQNEQKKTVNQPWIWLDVGWSGACVYCRTVYSGWQRKSTIRSTTGPRVEPNAATIFIIHTHSIIYTFIIVTPSTSPSVIIIVTILLLLLINASIRDSGSIEHACCWNTDACIV